MSQGAPDRPVRAAALEAIDRGWSVVPVGPVEAVPLVGIDAHEHHRATADEVRRWWQRWPDARLGLVTGMLSGVLVVEVDQRHGGDGTLAHLEAEFTPLPRTAEVRLGGRERQVWFRHDGPRVTGGAVAEGVGVQADGGLVVLPPSPHPSGLAYEWAVAPPPDGHLPLPPDWVLDLARHPRVERPPTVEQLHLPVGGHLLTPPTAPQRPGPTTLVPGPPVEVVGESRHQRELSQLAGGRRPHGVNREVTAELVPLEGDAHDRHALGVRVLGTAVGRVVGADAERCRPAVVAAIGHYGVATCRAVIRGGWDHDRVDRGRFGITLYLSPELPPEPAAD